jgi:pimeloyl-ACP methyl ester carboxylesterase
MPLVAQGTIYYLPGYGGQLGTGLGQGLMDRGFDVTGRETRGDFRNLPFEDQVRTVMQDLQDHFWHEQAQVVCNSFGSYLFLHAQSQLPAFVGRVLLLSPIVGEFTNEQARTSFSPPRPERLKQLAQAGQFKPPVNCEIHVGEDDWQSIPANVQVFGRITGIPVTVVPKGGHDLGKGYVGPLLDRWLVRG